MDKNTFNCEPPKSLKMLKASTKLDSMNDVKVYEDNTTGYKWYLKKIRKIDSNVVYSDGIMELYGSAVSNHYLTFLPEDIMLCNTLVKVGNVTYVASKEIKNFIPTCYVYNSHNDSLCPYVLHTGKVVNDSCSYDCPVSDSQNAKVVFKQAYNFKKVVAFSLFNGLHDVECNNIGIMNQGNYSYLINIDFQNFDYLNYEIDISSRKFHYLKSVHQLNGEDSNCTQFEYFSTQGYLFGGTEYCDGFYLYKDDLKDELVKLASISFDEQILYDKFLKFSWYFEENHLNMHQEIEKYVQFIITRQDCVKDLYKDDIRAGILVNHQDEL